jgi:hypothetical protein
MLVLAGDSILIQQYAPLTAEQQQEVALDEGFSPMLSVIST